MTDADENYRAAAALLEGHPDYRVLRRLEPRRWYAGADEPMPQESHRVGLFVDAETTGVEPTRDKIIEAGVIPFQFDSETGQIFSIGEAYGGFEDPGEPLSAEIVELTGITDADVAGQVIDTERVHQLALRASLVVAYHAEFDRPFFENRFPFFADMPWACALRQIPWRDFGVRAFRLTNLMADMCGVFYEAHRAVDDCRAGIHLLADRTVPLANHDGPRAHSARTKLSYLLESARIPTMRLFAYGSDFDAKDAMKHRGYKARYRAGKFVTWYRDCSPEEMANEEAWVVQHAGVRPPVQWKKVSALSRYSLRD